MRNRITPRNRSLYGFVGELYVLALSHWRVSGVDGRDRLELYFLESALPENSDRISCSGCENSRSSGKKPNFDPKPQKTRNDSSYQLAKSAIMPLETNCCSQNSRTRTAYWSGGISLGMVSTHRLASWEFHCFSTASAAFHKVLRSAYSCGAFAGSRISLWTIPRFSG